MHGRPAARGPYLSAANPASWNSGRVINSAPQSWPSMQVVTRGYFQLDQKLTFELRKVLLHFTCTFRVQSTSCPARRRRLFRKRKINFPHWRPTGIVGLENRVELRPGMPGRYRRQIPCHPFLDLTTERKWADRAPITTRPDTEHVGSFAGEIWSV